MDSTLREIADHFKRADRVLFITGAGLSADSGLPTYRGIGGLYDNTSTQDRVPIEEALSGPMLQKRPELTWKYIAQMERACRGATYNEGHNAIAQMEKDKAGTWVLTQNVDGFHHRAGSRQLIEIHGRLTDLVCTACPYAASLDDYASLEIPPSCPACQGLVRPNVVLFGEMLPQRAVQRLYAELARSFDLVFSIGTTSVFPYISEPVLQARRQGLPTVEINPGESDISHLVDYRLQERAAPTLARLRAAVEGF